MLMFYWYLIPRLRKLLETLEMLKFHPYPTALTMPKVLINITTALKTVSQGTSQGKK
jgi:hypothetical protein